MNLYWQHNGLSLYHGNVADVLRKLPEKSVHCCVTSPPYWALRSYLKANDPLKPLELGSEKTPGEHVAAMVAVFEQVKRVLRDDGLLWVNYGFTWTDLQCAGIPERFALAMQAAGWIWRDTIIWRKLSPMPASLSGTSWQRCKVKVGTEESQHEGGVPSGWRAVDNPDRTGRGNNSAGSEHRLLAQYIPCPGCDRCRDTGGYVLRRGSWRTTPSHEYIFMFAKKAGYFADQEGVKEKGNQQIVTGRMAEINQWGLRGTALIRDSLAMHCRYAPTNSQPPLRPDVQGQPVSRGPFCHLPSRFTRVLHQGFHVARRMLPGLSRAMG